MSTNAVPELRAEAPYEPIERIGAGAMGEVWLARDGRSGGRVVIKVMHGHLPEVLVDRLRLEAQALQRIAHPNVVRILDWGSTKDLRPFIVLELLTGAPLDKLMRERSFTLAESVSLVLQLLSALTAAHETGVVHRDVKPSNAFICAGTAAGAGGLGTLKLLDFGIIKLVETVTGVAPIAVPTKAGTALGTPKYMSPEQCRGKAVDGRSDLYSVGIMLYELVAGRHPFADATKLEQMMIAHARRIPSPPSSVAKQPIPPRLDGIILTALAKDPNERHPNAAEMARALKFFVMDFLGVDGTAKPATAADDGTIVPIADTVMMAEAPREPKILPFAAVASPATRKLPAAAIAPRTLEAAATPPQPAAAPTPAPLPAVVALAESGGVGAPPPKRPNGVPVGGIVLAFLVALAVVVGLYLALAGSW